MSFIDFFFFLFTFISYAYCLLLFLFEVLVCTFDYSQHSLHMSFADFLACSICSLLSFQSLFFLALFEPNEALFHLALFGDLFVVFFLFQSGCLPPTNLSPLERNVKCSFHRFIFVSFLHALFSCHSPLFSMGFSSAQHCVYHQHMRLEIGYQTFN